jgi:small subunit ribosomal protein S7
MPRRAKVSKRVVLPDPVYHSKAVTKFTNSVMLEGKKSVAESIVYNALNRIQKSTGADPLEVFERAIRNVTPIIEVKARRIGGATYQVPVEIKPDRRLALARRWIIRFARARAGRSMAEKLAGELLDAANGTGAAVKRKDETHKMAESNKAFSHYKF